MNRLQFSTLTAGMILILKLLLLILMSRNITLKQLERKYDEFDALIKDWHSTANRVSNL